MKTQVLKKMLLVSAVVISALSLSAFAYDVQGGTVKTSSVLNMRSGPATTEAVITKLDNETRVAILGENDDWYKIAVGGVNGYVHSSYVEVQPIMNIEAGGAQVTTEVLNLRSAPNTSSEIVTRLVKGTVAKIIGINSGWFKVTTGGNTGYIHPDYVTVVSYTTIDRAASGSAAAVSGTTSATRQAIVDYAATFLGVKYSYGGISPKGFDCSGLTKYVFSHFNISIARTSADQYASSVNKISKSELQPGDLVFFSNGTAGRVGHVGIYVGNDQFIHAPSPGKVVQYDSLNSNYYSRNYIGAGSVF